MFDKDLHKEYVFLSYLIGLLPVDKTAMIDLEGKLKLEYYKLEKTFEGAIRVEEEKGKYAPARPKGAGIPEAKKPLDEVIDMINAAYNGTLTDADRVISSVLMDKLMADDKLAAMAKTSDPKIFTESIFPKIFAAAAQDSYMKQQKAFSSMFENKDKYEAIMGAIGSVLYREMRKNK